MTSSDIRDVLNLPDGLSGPRPSKKQKTTAPRPNLKGLAREVHNLGGDNPIAIVPEAIQFKRRRLVSKKPAARWELRAFRNSGREDPSLVLRHWKRMEKERDYAAASAQDSSRANGDVQLEDLEDSSFAKFSVQVTVPQYSDDQYRQVLQNPDWSKEETDYLMEVVRDFDIRWPVIWDRYEWCPAATNGDANADGDESKAIVPARRNRSMEELKARYYEVASRMMAVQKPVQYMTQPEFALHEMMAHFNPQQEKLRKEFALNALGRSKEEAREEESLLLEIKRILARSERLNEDRRELYNRLDYPHAEQDINTFKSSAGLQTLLQNLMSADKSKKRKSIMGAEGGANTPSQGPAQPVAPEPARRDSSATSASHRDSIAPSAAASASASAPASASTSASTSKKAQQLQQQQQAQQQQQQQAQQQQQPLERRKLTEQDEAIYGVTHHDRLGSGPTFRTEKINKLFSHKSNQQQLRITNTLNELDVPSKLAMPTAATTQAFEALLASVNSLLDARKISDKLDAEIKLETAKKAEREKSNALAGARSDQREAGAEEQDEKEEETPAPEGATSTRGEKADSGVDKDHNYKKNKKELQVMDDETIEDASQAPDATPEEEAHPSVEGDDDEDVDDDDDEDDDEDGDGDGNAAADKEKTHRTGRGGTSHKRSASVLSAASDKSAKRQKKL